MPGEKCSSCSQLHCQNLDSGVGRVVFQNDGDGSSLRAAAAIEQCNILSGKQIEADFMYAAGWGIVAALHGLEPTPRPASDHQNGRHNQVQSKDPGYVPE